MLKYLLSFFILVSCSSNQFKKVKDVDTKEVEKKFDLSSGELQQFLTKEKQQNIKKVPHKKVVKKRRVAKKSSHKHKKHHPNKQKIRKKITQQVPKAIVKQSRVIDKKVEEKKHKDYPEKFITFDKRSKKIWSRYKENIYVGEEAKYKVKYLGVTAGFITLSTMPLTELNGQEVYHLKAGVKTANYYSMIYWLNDSIHSYIQSKEFLPLKYILAQREKKQTIDDMQLFDRDKLQTLFLFYKKKKGKEHRKHVIKPIPYYFQDSFSSIFFIRGLNPQVGDVFEYPIVNKARYWILKMKVDKREKIDIMGRDIEAFRVSAETHFPGALKKSGDIFFWFATDAEHRLLKFQGEVKIGSIKGELVSFKRGKKLAPR